MPNYVLLEKITVGAAGASSVTFSGIPQTGYTDLKIVMSARSNRAAEIDDLFIIKPNNSSSNLTYRFIRGSGSGVTSGTTGNMYITATNATASTFSNNEIYIPNYAGSTNKSMSVETVEENNATDSYSSLMAILWSDTTAISSIVLAPVFGSAFVQYSTFYLYGVAKLGTTPAIVPYATGGDTIMTDGTYWYHTFVSSGTFTPQKSLSCDYLVVAGGGGGGADIGGGGGAGGLRSTVTATGGGGSLETPLSVAANTGYTVTIGAGGAIQTSSGSAGYSGSNSVFSTITSTGGGGGGASTGSNALNGGSGGGACGFSNGGPANINKGIGTANQGYNGGTGSDTASNYGAGGGGGAGAVGVNGTSTTGGNGGAGVAVSISGTSVTYAGGGGAGVYGNGTIGNGQAGGGNGGKNAANGTSATANTGSGGGGAAESAADGGAGGSGIVIVRYAV
jgi:hypothetical protein